MFDLEEEINKVLETMQFEEDLRASFVDKCYILNKKAPNPFWTFSYSANTMIKLVRMVEVVPLTQFDKTKPSIECLAQNNVVKIPTEYITEMDWH